MKQFASIIKVAAIGLFSISALTLTSCHKESTPITYLTYDNDTYTPVIITANGVQSTIQPQSSVTYSGPVGSVLNVSAYTYGTTSSGTQVGTQIVWTTSTLSANFPTADIGTTVIGVDVSNEYFYLYVQDKNLSNELDGLYVNYNTTAQTFDNISIPNDGNTYGTGYYPIYTTTEIYMPLSGGGYVTSYPYNSLSGNLNQSYTMVVN